MRLLKGCVFVFTDWFWHWETRCWCASIIRQTPQPRDCSALTGIGRSGVYVQSSNKPHRGVEAKERRSFSVGYTVRQHTDPPAHCTRDPYITAGTRMPLMASVSITLWINRCSPMRNSSADRKVLLMIEVGGEWPDWFKLTGGLQ